MYFAVRRDAVWQTRGRMTTIRDNVFRVSYHEIGKPTYHGFVDVPGGGKLLIDQGDIRYIREATADGYEPTFFISRTTALGNDYVVVGRQWKA
ncbi:hypothetical protein OP10G_0663 [Fimbriimonas ginsengisoli Gsoil 348]|uniref:Uncharacterized protein n=2 Tax=Fimbriimonas ginsengisoli TaxID=1005039 RepID=A0A068NKM3_FIMGI|nr:hypothetical protein OP10G_0663 [Fimbriimonas ginsengisoli Gsoil 348]